MCPQAGQLAQPWIRLRSPSREEEESRRANRSTRIAAPAAFSRFVSGTRTGVLQTGQRAGFRQVQVMGVRVPANAPKSPPPRRRIRSSPLRRMLAHHGASPAMRDGTPREIVEVLSQLNRAEMEGRREGLELDELHHFLPAGPFPP